MIGLGGCRILSNAPVTDAVEIRVERAKENASKKMRSLRKRGREKMKALGERGKERLCAGTKKFFLLEEKIEKVFMDAWRSHKDKANALITIFILGNMGWGQAKKSESEREEIKESLHNLEDALNRRERRAHGSIYQDASGWYNQCGLPRYPVVSGRGQSHLYSAQNRRVNDSAE